MTPVRFPFATAADPPPDDARGGIDSETLRSIQQRAEVLDAQRAQHHAELAQHHAAHAREHDEALELHAEATRIRADGNRRGLAAAAVGVIVGFWFL